MAELQSRFERWAQIAGLLATAWAVWATSVAPLVRGRGFPVGRIAWALGIVACALGWSVIIGLTLLFAIRRLNRQEVDPPAMRLSALVWFAPATVLLLQFSPMSWVAGLALVVSATRLLFAPAPVGIRASHFVPALAIAAGFETGVVALLMNYRVSAVLLIELSTAMLIAVAFGVGAWVEDRPPNLPRSVFALVLMVLLSLIAGVTGGSGWGFGFGRGSEILPLPERAKPQADRPDPNAGVTVPGDYEGVILWPEIKPVTTLVAPLTRRGGASASAFQRLSIPFGGEYWMFRRPFLRPPPGSFLRRGTPAMLFFSTTDRRPLEMEARQKLEQSIALDCCRGMQIEIRNADRHPGTVSVEAALIDGERPGVAESLGIAPVTSVPDLQADPTTPVPETLDFRFPLSPRLDRFDQIKVIFHRAIGRVDKSARVSIERFVLMPAE